MRARALGLALAVAVGALAGCFSPQQPGCAFSCGPAGACPQAYSCGTDNLCHRDDGLGMCLIAPQDGGPATSDAASDVTATGDASDAASAD